MNRNAQIIYHGKQTFSRFVALAVMILFIAVSLLSETFILTHADHEHDHNGFGGACATCAQIQGSENLLKQLSTAVIGTSSVIAGLFAAVAVLWSAYSYVTLYSPVTLKIKMNN